MMKKSIPVIFAFAALMCSVKAADIKFTTSLKDGDRLSGVVVLQVTIESSASINSVEFYVNDQLRGTDSSTPYEFTIDTLTEKEGGYSIEIAAYASDGSSKKLKLNLTIDNELGKGAAFHLDNATRFLNNSKWTDAIGAARVALKADEGSVPARLVLARAFLGRGILDEAQKWAEDAMLLEESPESCELVAGILVERAFKVSAFGGDKKEQLKQMFDDLKGAVTNKRRAMELRIRAVGAETDENRVRLADLHMASNEFSTAIRLLRKNYNEFEPDISIAGRLMFASMRSGRMNDVAKILANVEKRSAKDAMLSSLESVGYAYYRHYEKAADALKTAILSDPDSSSVMTASAFLAVRKNDTRAIASQIQQMIKKNITDPEVFYYLSLLQFWTGDYVNSRENFKKAVTQNPLFVDAYIQRGFDALNTALTPAFAADKEYLLEMALGYMEVARLARPDSAEALNGTALVLLYQGKDKEGLAMAGAAANAGPEYPWAHFTLAAARQKNRDPGGALKAVDAAGKLDGPVLSGRGIPTVDEAWVYTLRHGRLPVVIPPR